MILGFDDGWCYYRLEGTDAPPRIGSRRRYEEHRPAMWGVKRCT